MPLSPGTKIGSYEVLAKLGEGGMGEVYRARDARLNRDVALKVLPQAFALDPDRLARFRREAQVLASLNHQNIAAIYGFEESPDVQGLALELVEGPTLADRIAGGPIPIDESLAIAKQIADALEAAHEQGIVHRDLKPANIKLRPDGTVKVLDFGLAKLVAGEAAGAGRAGWRDDLADSPTLTSPAIGATGVGVILGTAAYMAPEQAKGRAADKRSDIWAYGVVLVEMLSGTPVYSGETVSEVLAAVIMKEPDLDSLPATLPAPVRRLIRRCLQKDPKRRMRDIGEARLALEGTAEEDTPVQPVRGTSNRWLVGLTAVLAVALAATVGLSWRDRTVVSPPVITRYEVNAPAKTSLNLADRPAVALSPDGSALAFVVLDGGANRLFLRRRTEGEARAVPGSEGATEPVFSPDGRALAFFAETALKRYADDSITSIAKIDVTNGRGLTWLDDGSLVYPPSNATGLVQVSSNGGDPKVVSTLDRSKGERTHRWPHALPGSNVVLFTVGTQANPDDYDGANIEALVLATGERRLVLKGASMASYVPTGHLIFARGGSLYAVRFDAATLTVREPAHLVVQGVAGDRTTGASHFSVAGDGTLAYVSGAATTGDRRLVWADRQGQLQPLDLPAGYYADPQISPDGTRLALTVGTGDTRDVWIHNFSTKTLTRLTFGGQNWTPVWSVDGRDVFYVAIEGGIKTSLLRKPADGSADAQRLAQIEGEAYLTHVQGNTAIFDFRDPNSQQPQMAQKFHLVTLDLKTPGKVVPIVATTGGDLAGVVSPNGRFLAYGTDESGRAEVYVRDFPGPGGRWQVSTAGGEEPHWSANGRELFYRNNDLFMAAGVDTRAAFQASTPALLFKGVYNIRTTTLLSFAVDPKGDRFLMIRPLNEEGEASRVHVVLNWFEELKQRMAAR